jgi:ABC-type glycerol-3-phosphate transport system permease component
MNIPKILRKNLKKVSIYAILLVLVVFAVAPYYYIFISSIKPKDEVLLIPPTVWTWKPTFESYYSLFFETKKVPWFFESLVNTIILSTISTALAIFLGLFSGYAFSRFNFRGKNFAFKIILLRNLFPGVAFLIPYYIFLTYLRLINTYEGLIFTYLAFNLPLSIWLIRGFIDSVPEDYEEQALVDGCSRIGAVFKILFPIIRPGIISVFMYCFSTSWIEYILPLALWTTKKTLTVTLATLVMGEYLIDWRLLFSSTIIMTLPTIAIFYYLQKYITYIVGGIKA